MADAILYALPPLPDPDRRETHWWRVANGRIVEAGAGAEWLELLATGAGERPKRIALAPAAAVRLKFADRPGEAATPRQAEAVARVAAVDESLGSPESLHSVSSIRSNGEEGVLSAIVDNGLMSAWLEWSKDLGADPDHVVPVGALLPLDEQWTEAEFGSERLIGRRGLVMPFEPELARHVVGNAEIRSLPDPESELALIAAAENPPLDLRAGRFARRRRIAIDRDRIRELAILASFIPILALIWSLASIYKLQAATAQLDSETVAIAETALGRPVTIENAEAELAQRFGSAATGGLMPPLTALYQALQSEESVSATEISYRADGTLSSTLAAPTVDAINRALVAIQRDGYRITAVPRQSPDGRTMVDMTVRSGP